MAMADPAGSGLFEHVPVLAEAVLAGFACLPPGLLIDCTLGGGGHSALLLQANPGLRLVGLDQDPSARAAAAERLAPFGDRVTIVAANFADYIPAEPAVAVLADLGVSSPQLDVAARGFSFRAEGPIDMRMNPEAGETAAQLIDLVRERAKPVELILEKGVIFALCKEQAGGVAQLRGGRRPGSFLGEP